MSRLLFAWLMAGLALTMVVESHVLRPVVTSMLTGKSVYHGIRIMTANTVNDINGIPSDNVGGENDGDRNKDNEDESPKRENLPDGDGEEENEDGEDEGNGQEEGEKEEPPSKDTACAATVQTEGGSPIQGFQWQPDLDVCAYIDIPYGKYEGRFQAPVEAEPWTEPHNEKTHAKACPQILNDGRVIDDDDCLVLSVFSPKETKDAPILFHIHGGNLREGSADPALYGPEYIVPNNVILVLPNYRLGVLGFLCLRNSTAPGNAALKDLTLALEWVKKNIQKFGGDPNKITISGDGRAGALVGLLALSPQSRDLFSRAITESGSMLSPWALDRDPVTKARRLVEALSEHNAECTPPYEFIEEVSLNILLTETLNKGLKFAPCLEDEENAFLNETPWKIIQSHTTNKTFLIGSADKSGLREALEHNQEALENLNEEREGLVPSDLLFSNTDTRTNAAKDIADLYFEDDDITEENRDKLALYYTDALYLGPSLRSARALRAAGATVYLYEFAYVGALNRERKTLDTTIEGAVRGDLYGYLFAQEGLVPTEEDVNMRKLVMELWISFMKTGEPKSCPMTWRPLSETSAAEEPWLALAAEPGQQHGLHPRRLDLWTRLYRDHYVDNAAGTVCLNRLLLIIFSLHLFFVFIKYSYTI